eukprot:1149564-Prymnesium_polylepis.1
MRCTQLRERPLESGAQLGLEIGEVLPHRVGCARHHPRQQQRRLRLARRALHERGIRRRRAVESLRPVGVVQVDGGLQRRLGEADGDAGGRIPRCVALELRDYREELCLGLGGDQFRHLRDPPRKEGQNLVWNVV